MKEAPPGGRRGFFRISHAWRGGREDRHCGPLSTLRSSVNPYRGVAGYPKMKEAPPGERGFFLNVHVERDVMARGEATTRIGLSLWACGGAVILSHDQTRRTLRLSASRVRDAGATLPGHYRRMTLAMRYRFAARRGLPSSPRCSRVYSSSSDTPNKSSMKPHTTSIEASRRAVLECGTMSP